jgi:hypothetical protein
MRRVLISCGSFALAWALLVSGVFAQSPSYVGTWAVNVGSCGLGQEMQGAPLVVSKRRYDQHESHCKFDSIRAQDRQWHVIASCSVEGDMQKHAFTLIVAGRRLTMREQGRRAVVYRRCN